MAGSGGSGTALPLPVTAAGPARRSCQTRAPRPPVLPVPTALAPPRMPRAEPLWPERTRVWVPPPAESGLQVGYPQCAALEAMKTTAARESSAPTVIREA